MQQTTPTSAPQSATSATPSLRPDATQGRPGTQSGDASTASIKSGVIGFPQGAQASQAATSSSNPAGERLGGAAPEQGSPSHLGRDAAIGTGAAGAGGLAAHELGSQREDNSYNNTSHATEQQPYERALEEPTDATGTYRSFPLAGGVTTGRPAENTSSTLNPATREREPGTKEKEAGVHDGQGREALAGAAAAATASSTLPGHKHEQAVDSTSQENTTRGGHHPEALAAATAAVSKHEHGGRGHDFIGDPCATEDKPSTADQHRSGLLFTSGPHATDTANRLDPRLHVPGEFPSPTPVDEPSEPSYMLSKEIPAAGDQHELRHTGTLDQPQTRTAEEPEKEHHYGRDATIAGGLGAAGAGAYEAGKHHQKEPAEIGGETFSTEASPYSSTKLDPRVHGKPAAYEKQKFDPSTSEKHHGRDAALTGGTLGSAGLAGSEITRPHETRDTVQSSATQPQSTSAAPHTEDEKHQHQYGRDATLVGAGAATAGGLYYAGQHDKQDSGPASSTIGPHKSNVANVFDPRAQPDPALQKHHHADPKPEDPASATVGPHKSNIANVMDPRVLPDPEKQKGHTTTGPHKSDTLNRLDPKADRQAQPQAQHHYGRDAAVAGGAGAAGYGAYETAKAYGDHRSTGAEASMNDQRYDPSAPGAHQPSITTHPHTADPNQKDQHHYGRDAAVAGGLGAAGAGAYAATREHEHAQQSPMTRQQYPTGQEASPYPPYQGAQQPSVAYSSQQATAAGHQRYDSTQDPNKQHQKRDAATLGAAGAAGAGGAYAYTQHDAEKERQAQQKAHEQQLKDQQKEFEKKQKETEKQQAKDAKHHDKLVAAEEKKHQKEMDQEQKHHDKLAASEEKKHQKELEKEQKQHEKEAEKEQKQHEKEAEKEEEGKKKHHLFGFLHRDKKDKEDKNTENSPRESRDSPRHSKEYAGAGAAAGVAGGAAAYEATRDNDSDSSEGKKRRSKLHKNPPPGHPAREVMEEQHQTEQGGKPLHMGTDGPIGDPNQISGDQ